MPVAKLNMQRASRPAAFDLDAELVRIASLTTEQLRAEWRTTMGFDPPPSLSRDLIARVLSHRLQEKALGSLSPQLQKTLDASGKGEQPSQQRIKPGSVLVREYGGVLHEVTIIPEGFSWRGEAYASLSTIARKITGTKWSGPRFFGLRDVQPDQTKADTAASTSATGKDCFAPPRTKACSSKAFLGGAP
jgi:hypothetical protein